MVWGLEFNLQWREADPQNHLDDKVDSDQQVVNKELSRFGVKGLGPPPSEKGTP